MDPSNKPTSFDTDFYGLYLGSSELSEQTCKSDPSEQSLTYKGMSVQKLEATSPAYHNRSDIPENNAGSVTVLNKYDIETLKLIDTADFFGSDIPEIPTSVLDEYVPWHSNKEKEPANDTLSPRPDTPFIQQVCLSGNEPPVDNQPPEDQSTNLPAVPSPSNPPGIQPVTVPLNKYQTTSDNLVPTEEGTADGNASVVPHTMVLNTATERRRKYQREYQRERRKDPVHAERLRKLNREYKRELRKNPVYAALENKRRRQYAKERYWNDPDYAERMRQKGREHYYNHLNCAKQQKEQKNERYHNDPDFAKHIRELRKQRYYKYPE